MFLSCFFHSLTFLCVVEPEDKAVATLVTHFTQVITDVVDNKWSHLPTEWLSKKNKRYLSLALATSRSLGFWILIHNLSFLVTIASLKNCNDIRMKVVQSLRSFNFSHYTPLIQEIFHDLDFGIENSGINVLFTPPKRGRPSKAAIKKRKRQEMDMEYLPANSFSKRRSRRRGGPKRSKLVRDLSWIILQVTLIKFSILPISSYKQEISNGKVEVLVEWDDRSSLKIHLNSPIWWYLLRDCRYPLFHH